MSYGRYFEELEPGQEFRHWPGRTITEFDDTLFSLMSMNQHPLHSDEHFAAKTQHGRRLVEGPLVIALVVGISQADTGGRALATLEYRDIRHLSPVFHGDSIYAESVILNREERDAVSGIVTIASRGLNQRGEVVVTLDRVIVVPKQPAVEAHRRESAVRD